MRSHDDVQTASVPGGTLLNAALNRNVMGLADRGGASQIIGNRWADLVALHADDVVGQTVAVPFDGGLHTVTRVVRLDDDLRIARRAAKHGLQNPDLLYFGSMDGKPTVQAVDAKFSIETAKSKQVSVEMLQKLLTLGDFFDRAIGGIDERSHILPGLFITPDTPVTRHVLRIGRGIIRLSVDPTEIVLLQASSDALFEHGEEMPLMLELYALDHHEGDPRSNILGGLYYFRLSRAAVSAWVDMRRPLLAFGDSIEPHMWSVASDIAARAERGGTAWGVITEWIEEADVVNRQRAVIDRAASLPLASRDLREWIEHDAGLLGIDPPSVNKVRRRLGAWHRGQLRERVGPIEPPRHDLEHLVQQVTVASRDLVSQLRPQVSQIIEELARQQSGDEDQQIDC